jgi:hypothetical protein
MKKHLQIHLCSLMALNDFLSRVGTSNFKVDAISDKGSKRVQGSCMSFDALSLLCLKGIFRFIMAQT